MTLEKLWAAARPAISHGLGTGFLAVFCYATARCVPTLHETYWAPIAAVVVLYPDWAATRTAALQRFFGTTVGSLIGWGTAVIWNGHLLIWGAAVALAVGLCYLLRQPTAARLCAVAVTVITIIPRHEPASWVAFARFCEVCYGVACAVAYTAVATWAGERFGQAPTRGRES